MDGMGRATPECGYGDASSCFDALWDSEEAPCSTAATGFSWPLPAHNYQMWGDGLAAAVMGRAVMGRSGWPSYRNRVPGNEACSNHDEGQHVIYVEFEGQFDELRRFLPGGSLQGCAEVSCEQVIAYAAEGDNLPGFKSCHQCPEPRVEMCDIMNHLINTRTHP